MTLAGTGGPRGERALSLVWMAFPLGGTASHRLASLQAAPPPSPFTTRTWEPRLVDLRHLDPERNLAVAQSHPFACETQRGHGTSKKPPSQQAVQWDRAWTVPREQKQWTLNGSPTYAWWGRGREPSGLPAGQAGPARYTAHAGLPLVQLNFRKDPPHGGSPACHQLELLHGGHRSPHPTRFTVTKGKSVELRCRSLLRKAFPGTEDLLSRAGESGGFPHLMGNAAVSGCTRS